MLRQDPVSKKRGALNLVNRFLLPEKLADIHETNGNVPANAAPTPVAAVPVAPVVATEPVQAKGNRFTVGSIIQSEPLAAIQGLQQELQPVQGQPQEVQVPAEEPATPLPIAPIPQSVQPVLPVVSELSVQQGLSYIVETANQLLKQLPAESQEQPLNSFVEKTRTFFESQPDFRLFQEMNNTRSESLKKRMNRTSAFSKQRSLVLFPSVGAAEQPVFANYYVQFNNEGIVLNPDASFFDAFFLLGGTTFDIQKIIFTETPKENAPVFRHLKLFVPDVPIENVSAGLVAVGNTQFIAPFSSGLPFNEENIQTKNTLTVFAVETLEDLYWAAAEAKEIQSELTLFDYFPSTGFASLSNVLNSFLGNSTIWSPVSSFFAGDVQNKCFLDAVKANVSETDCWSNFSQLAFATDAATDEHFYFSQENHNRFETEHEEILETFQYYLRKRKGLYFD
jgi:hypothetical protein